MIASILRAHAGDLALATQGNLNNHIGVPLTLLRLRTHQWAVLELGMNHPGEIGLLADLAQPTVALVNNAQREHQEFMGTVEAVARENGEVLRALGPQGVAVFPADDVYTPLWQDLAGDRPVLRFAETPDADVWGAGDWAGDHWRLRLHTPVGEAEVALRVAGRHNLRNALAATASALAAGVPLAQVVQGLNAFLPVKGRSQLHALPMAGSVRTLVDDSYNANPDSVQAAMAVLAELPGPRWLVLGDMGEVGEQGPQFHAEAGTLAARCGLETVWCVGQLAAHAAVAARTALGAQGVVRYFETTAQALAALAADGPPAFVSALVKGSRFMRMEQVVQALQAAAEPRRENNHAA
jgi:UDP-N-acetylmuramoyl-tripeptide--D-alanyl-D-alanine ligase